MGLRDGNHSGSVLVVLDHIVHDGGVGNMTTSMLHDVIVIGIYTTI